MTASRFALGVVLVLLAGCKDPAEANGTALLVSMDIEENLGVQQLRTVVHPPDGEPLRPTLVPDPPREPLGRSQSLRLLLPDSLAGQTVVVTVEGLASGKRVAQGDASAAVVDGMEVEVPVHVRAFTEGLEGEPQAPLPPGGPQTPGPVTPDACKDVRCAPGQHCVDGECLCDAASCDGCCQGNVCMRGDTVSTCGSGGAQCETCPAEERCQAGRCEGCDATTCPDGCCSGNSCIARTATACGPAGGACQSCGEQADRCAEDGQCACGEGAACGAGQRCVGGSCVCDESTCEGCCTNGQCLTGNDVNSCGAGGAACGTCAPERSDNCSSGACGCGVGPACGDGQACVQGTCVCTPETCGDGCCVEGVCRRDVPPQQCEGPSNPCSACNDRTSDNCQDGRCQCGSGPSCASGQECVAGQCLCTRSACAGCCADNLCQRGNSVEACGRRGAACEGCNLQTANNCAQGGCRCGRIPECQNGRRCDGERCVSGGI